MLGDDHLILFSINIDKIPCRRGAARSLKKGTSCGSLTCDLRKVLINNVDTSTLGGCVFKGGTGPWKEVNTGLTVEFVDQSGDQLATKFSMTKCSPLFVVGTSVDKMNDEI